MAESSSKRRKAEENAGGCTENESEIDRISNLPDSVLCHILSFLPTKTSVTTSLLSRRWRHLWEHLQVLNLNDDSHLFYHHVELFKRFAVFVNAVLALRTVRHIRKFCLSCGHSQVDPFYAYSVATWLRAAIGPHLEELHLTLYSTDGNGFVVPAALFTCTNLVSLSLSGGIHLILQKPDSVIQLPLLKKLQLDIDSVNCIGALVSGCPVLETLHISFSPSSLAKVCVPRSLKNLRVAVENEVETALEIHAPDLKSLTLVQQKTRCFSWCLGDLRKVVEAYLDVYAVEQSAEPLFKLFRALSGLKSLQLRSLAIKWLLRGPNLDFPQFHYLVRLDIILPSFNSGFLMNMLHKCRVLEVLLIQNEREPSFARQWVQPTSDPSCLGSHLSFVQFKGYQGYADELAFAAYILRKGRALRTMFIYGDILLDLNYSASHFIRRFEDRSLVACLQCHDFQSGQNHVVAQMLPALLPER